MTDRFRRAHEETARHEGGWSDHAADPGGATMYGITQKTLSKWRGYAVTKAEVRALERSEAEAIYHARYWLSVRADDLPEGVAFAVYDYAVNSGPRRAIKSLQKAVGASPDGILGGMTLAAVERADPASVVKAICAERLAFMKSLKTWKTFGRGWGKRVNSVKSKALAMIGACPTCGQPLAA